MKRMLMISLHGDECRNGDFSYREHGLLRWPKEGQIDVARRVENMNKMGPDKKRQRDVSSFDSQIRRPWRSRQVISQSVVFEYVE
jgi:hypothetical protein